MPSASGRSPPNFQKTKLRPSTSSPGTRKPIAVLPGPAMVASQVIMSGSPAPPRFCDVFQMAMPEPRFRLGYQLAIIAIDAGASAPCTVPSASISTNSSA